MAGVPKKTGGRKPTAKKTFSLADFKKKVGVEDVPNKPLRWIELSEAIKKQTGLPGFPIGYVSLSRGFSNTGKSTSISEAIVSAQKMGILPIIIDTENNIGRKRLESMGFDWDNDFYIFVDNEYILENFGKKRDKNRNEASIEDMAEMIHYFLDLQENGELPYDILFAIDSLGTLDCIRTINAHEKNTSDNNQWNAGAFEKAFKNILNNRIPASRKQNKQFTNTIIAVQKIWINNVGAGEVKHKGGEAFFYASRLIYHFGGIAGHGTKKVEATSKGNKVHYGIEAKIKVMKNHIDGEMGGISLEEGKIISTPHGFIEATKEADAEYKKEHIGFFRQILKDEDVTADDIGTVKTTVKFEEGDSDVINDMIENIGGDNVDTETGEVID